MSKKLRLLLMIAPFALLLAALAALPTTSFAANRTLAATPTPVTTTRSFAFAAMISKTVITNVPFAGALKLSIHSDGSFTGFLVKPGAISIPVNGQLKKDGEIAINLFDPKGHIFIKGAGKRNSEGSYVGTFQLVNGTTVLAAGRWSALPIADPSQVHTLSFNSMVTSGHDSGMTLSGVLVLHKQTLDGVLSRPNGDRLKVKGSFSNQGNHLTLIINIGQGQKIAGVSSFVQVPSKGYKGTFTGPSIADKGKWEAFFLNF